MRITLCRYKTLQVTVYECQHNEEEIFHLYYDGTWLRLIHYEQKVISHSNETGWGGRMEVFFLIRFANSDGVNFL